MNYGFYQVDFTPVEFELTQVPSYFGLTLINCGRYSFFIVKYRKYDCTPKQQNCCCYKIDFSIDSLSYGGELIFAPRVKQSLSCCYSRSQSSTSENPVFQRRKSSASHTLLALSAIKLKLDLQPRTTTLKPQAKQQESAFT